MRVGDLPDSSLVSVRLADNRRRCVATPEFVRRHGKPKHPGELSRFACLTLSSDASQTRGWAFRITAESGAQELIHLRPSGPLDCSDGQVLHDWCLAGHGIAWRSTWEVEAEIDAGLLVPLLDEFAAPPNGIYAVFAGASTQRCACDCGLISSRSSTATRNSGAEGCRHSRRCVTICPHSKIP